MTDSIGLVAPQTMHVSTPLEMVSGSVLPEYDLVYETYGTLNDDASNAVLICHALSGNHHVAGHYEGEKPAAGGTATLDQASRLTPTTSLWCAQTIWAVAWFHRPGQHQPGNRKGLWTGLSDRHLLAATIMLPVTTKAKNPRLVGRLHWTRQAD